MLRSIFAAVRTASDCSKIAQQYLALRSSVWRQTYNSVDDLYSNTSDVPVLSTVSFELVQELLASIERIARPGDLEKYLLAAGLAASSSGYNQLTRISHHQIVSLYQAAAVGTGDEMMGLWSRPIRSGALKYICKVVIDARTVERALFRFCQFWNLLLDDYHLVVFSNDREVHVQLRPLHAALPMNRFGHALMLKLTHGIASWLAGHELPCLGVAFSFARPSFADDYPILFPAPITFDAPFSSMTFRRDVVRLPVSRRPSEVRGFLQRAPRDWIYTALKEHAIQLEVREFLLEGLERSLADAAEHFHISPRTLVRRLAAANQSFRGIKDALRRDMAIHDLDWTSKSLDQISFDLGFSSVAVFHRAFKNWTGVTPGQMRRGGTTS